ncbi:MAG: DsbA family oxidoreductase [Muribaculaceae bacterium]|nr:DsbA family oxidoreductase [Muribaculaceae bacterium]
MKITIWFDFQCPFCYMGETMLEKALGEVELTEPVTIEYKAYELNPKAPAIPVETMTDHFMDGHKFTLQEAEEHMEKVTRMAARVGLDYHLAEAKVCNSLDAHRLMKFAAGRLTPGKLKKLSFSIFKAEFEEEELISDRQLLASLAEAVGLNGEEVMEMFSTDAFIAEVRKDEEEIEARSDFEFIPFMLLPDGSVKQGVVSVGGLRKWLQAAIDGNSADPDNAPDSDPTPIAGCSPSGCGV